MYKISDFSQVTGVSKDTLRYYDKIDFFKPNYVDYFSGYRYYEENQIKDIVKINKLKEFNLSLEEIKQYLTTNDNNILINKRKEMINIMNKIDEYLKNTNKTNYTIEEHDYKKYIELNGTKRSNCAQALEVRDGNAYYFIINNNDNFLIDFCVYKKNNWLTLDDEYLINNVLMEKVFEILEKYVTSIRLYISAEKEELITNLVNHYKNINISEIKQGQWLYKQLEINLNRII